MEKYFSVKNFSTSRRSGEPFRMENINFYLEKGEILALLGKNGSGKTTLIEALIGIKTYEGEIRLDRFDLETDAKAYRDSIAYVSHKWLFGTPRMAGASIKTLGYYLGGYYSRFSREKFDMLCDRLQLPRRVPVTKYSTGQKISFTVALALATNPGLLILDEPFANLDPLTRETLIGIIQEQQKEEMMSVIFASHLMDDLETITDRVLFLDHGRQALFADINEVQDRFFEGRKVNFEELYEIEELNTWKPEEEGLIGDEWKC